MKHDDRRERTTLERLERLHQHTEIIATILRNLGPIIRVAFLFWVFPCRWASRC